MAENRYSRQLQVNGFGNEAQQKLADAKVLVIGAGGLGVPALQYLTGMGVGTIGIMDGDKVSLSNLHRQVIYNENEVGQLKTDAILPKLKALNSTIIFKGHPYFLSVANALDTIKGYDLVIDASDNFGTRYLINDACVILNKPFVYGAIQQMEGHVSVFNYDNGPTYRCVYLELPQSNEIPNCNEAGVLGVVPGIIGCQQALQAVKVIIGLGKTLSGYLQIFDFNNDEQLKIKLKADPNKKAIRSLQADYDTPSAGFTGSLTVDELFEWYTSDKPFLLVDVREAKEFTQEHLQDSVSIPLSMLNDKADELPDNLPIITICEIGGRSSRAVQVISKAKPDATVYNVIGGIETWFDQLGDQFIIEPKNA
ncbi:HesA/MoeB/ThiF family protein [Mucilaginibacter sp. KACC 22063]|uniref:HesA/MoeB/ThiF family protein n=1 Tax=Mucilaginibacter sp. KACC 22063 TaxID=3025666 RepID=UPI0023672BA2|nr:HesA/MoeB/ThiF family protein [Mucilaginibacter sp. KACC 22063]WDF56919.1 HesA/MoeB/ThiF family protein [Mucilaginibacter sp. KACC 22063]